MTERGRTKRQKETLRDSRRTLKITPQNKLRRNTNKLYRLSRWQQFAAHLVTHSRGEGRKNILLAYD